MANPPYNPEAYVDASINWLSDRLEKKSVPQEQKKNLEALCQDLIDRRREIVTVLYSLMTGTLALTEPHDAPQFPLKTQVDTLTVALVLGDESGQKAETDRYRAAYLELVPTARNTNTVPGPLPAKWRNGKKTF